MGGYKVLIQYIKNSKQLQIIKHGILSGQKPLFKNDIDTFR